MSADLQLVVACLVRLAREGSLPRSLLDLNITAASTLDDLAVDSVGLMAVSMALEEEIGVTLAGEQFDGSPRTVSDLVDLVARARAPR